MNHFLDCGCCINDDGTRIWCPSCLNPNNSNPILLSEILKAVDSEPEYPGEMPLEMKKVLSSSDIETIAEALRITVRLTKQSIKERITALYR